MKTLLFNSWNERVLNNIGWNSNGSSLSKKELEQLKDSKYSIIFKKDNRDLGIVTITDIIKPDEVPEDNGFAMLYKDPEIIKKKILETINLSMNDIFKEDMIDIACLTYKDIKPVADLIYSVLQENFTIISQEFPEDGFTIFKIKKRGK